MTYDFTPERWVYIRARDPFVTKLDLAVSTLIRVKHEYRDRWDLMTCLLAIGLYNPLK